MRKLVFWNLSVNQYYIQDQIAEAKALGITCVYLSTRVFFSRASDGESCHTDRIEIHQSQPDSMTQRRLEGHTCGCTWWISIRSVNNTQDWRKFWKRFHGCLSVFCFPKSRMNENGGKQNTMSKLYFNRFSQSLF